MFKQIVNVLQPMPMIDPNFQQQMMLGGGHNTEEGTKLYISNLDYGVSNGDIQVGFFFILFRKCLYIHQSESLRSFIIFLFSIL